MRTAPPGAARSAPSKNSPKPVEQERAITGSVKREYRSLRSDRTSTAKDQGAEYAADHDDHGENQQQDCNDVGQIQCLAHLTPPSDTVRHLWLADHCGSEQLTTNTTLRASNITIVGDIVHNSRCRAQQILKTRFLVSRNMPTPCLCGTTHGKCVINRHFRSLPKTARPTQCSPVPGKTPPCGGSAGALGGWRRPKKPVCGNR